MDAQIIFLFDRSVECVQSKEEVGYEDKKSSYSFPELRSPGELELNAFLSEHAKNYEITAEGSPTGYQHALHHQLPHDLRPTVTSSGENPADSGFVNGSSNSSAEDLDSVVSKIKPELDCCYNGRIERRGVCFPTDSDYTQIKRNLSLAELTPKLNQQTSPIDKHSNSTSLPHKAYNSNISYHHGAKKQLKVAFANDLLSSQPNAAREKEQTSKSGAANPGHTQCKINDLSGFLSVTKYRNMEPLFLPSLILLAWAVVIAAEMQQSTFDKGQNGIFPRDGPQSTLAQPILPEPIVNPSSSKPNPYGFSDTSPSRIDANDGYCSTFQGTFRI